MAGKFGKSTPQANLGTVATTGNTDDYIVVPENGRLIEALYYGTTALSANDTNYITFTVTNLGQAGAGSTALLGAVDGNTTKATGGAAIAASTLRTMTLSTTSANLDVKKGDLLRVRAAASGTLANTVANSKVLLRFNWRI